MSLFLPRTFCSTRKDGDEGRVPEYHLCARRLSTGVSGENKVLKELDSNDWGGVPLFSLDSMQRTEVSKIMLNKTIVNYILYSG